MRNFQWKGFFRKNKKKIVLVFFCVLFSLAGSICYFYFNAEQIQNSINKKTCSLVLKHEEELLKTVEECRENGVRYLVSYETQEDEDYEFSCYKELNSEMVNKMFRTFRLICMSRFDNSIVKFDDSIVKFEVRPTVISVLWENYSYGFYYTETDKAYDVFWDLNECDEGEGTEGIIWGFGKYWYRTERIDNHWWFYESKIVEWYPMKR